MVGDEDQSIYGWRGADIRNILDFERDYPNAKVIRLEQNYRSTQKILEAAGAVVANNKARKGKNLWTDAGVGEPIRMYEAPDSENEALFIADTIEKVLRDDPNDRVAVLYRTNFQSRQIEEALRRYGRKYIVVGGFSFYQRAEVKDILAYMKVVGSPERLDQPAAHHQYTGAWNRQNHGRADRAVRARAQVERLGGDPEAARRARVSRRAPKQPFRSSKR